MNASYAALLAAVDAEIHAAPEPTPFTKESAPTAWPEDCLPASLAGAVAAIAEHVQAPQALAGFAVLGAVSHVAMRLVDARHPKKGALPCSIFLLDELVSGSRKSECYSLATAPVRKIEREQRQAHQKAVEGLQAEAARAKPKDRAGIMADAPPDPRTLFADTTVQAIEHAFVNGSMPALSLSTDEGGTLLGGHSLKAETRAASLGSLTRLFDGSGVQRDRVGEGQSGFRYGVRFGLFLSAQPIVLREALSDPVMRGQGFLPRFLYCAPQSLAGTRFHDLDTLAHQAADDKRIVTYWRTLERLCTFPIMGDDCGSLTLPTVGLSAGAVDAWLALYNDTELQQAPGGDFDHLGAFASRAGELASRLACIFAVWRSVEAGAGVDSITVDAADMEQAARLVKFSLSEWARQSGQTLSQSERDAVAILEWVQGKNFATITKKQIATLGPNRLRADATARQAAIAELVEHGYLRDVGNCFEVFQKSVWPAATANAAKSANKPLGLGHSVSDVSGISVSDPAKQNFDFAATVSDVEEF